MRIQKFGYFVNFPSTFRGYESDNESEQGYHRLSWNTTGLNLAFHNGHLDIVKLLITDEIKNIRLYTGNI